MNAAPDRDADQDELQAIRALMRGGLFLLGALVVAAVGGALSITVQSWGLAALLTIPVLVLVAMGAVWILTGVVLMVSSQERHS